MPVVGFNLEKASVQRNKQLQKGMQSKQNIIVSSITPEEIQLGEKSTRQGLKFSFEYEVLYEPGIGKVEINGSILYTDDEKKIKEIQKEWDKNKKMSPELTAKVLNTAIMKCTIKALSLSQEVNLPPHLPLPTIMPSPAAGREQDYIG